MPKVWKKYRFFKYFTPSSVYVTEYCNMSLTSCALTRQSGFQNHPDLLGDAYTGVPSLQWPLQPKHINIYHYITNYNGLQEGLVRG